MSSLPYVVAGSALVAASGAWSAQQLVQITRCAGKRRVPVWRAVALGPGHLLRLAVGFLLFGVLMIVFWGRPSTAGGWLVFGVMSSVIVWDRWVELRLRIRRSRRERAAPS